MNKEQIEIESLADLPRKAKEFLDLIGDRKIVALNGEMGAGKTTFISAVLRAMGIEDIDGSPTYSLVNVYNSKMFGKVYHFDLYRIEDEYEALDIGIEEMIYGDGVCLIEWPEKITNLLPEETIWSYIRRNQDDSRTLILEL